MTFLNQTISTFIKMHQLSENVHWFSSHDFKTIFHISPAYENVWHRPILDLYKNPDSWIKHLLPEDTKHHHPIKEMAKRVVEDGPNARYHESYRIILPTGDIRTILDKGHPVCGMQGTCIGVTGVAVDITDNLTLENYKKHPSYNQLTHYVLPEIIAKLSNQQNMKLQSKISLTKREIECILGLLKGKTAKEIGIALNLSYRTIEHVIERIKLKLKCRTRSQVIEKIISL